MYDLRSLSTNTVNGDWYRLRVWYGQEISSFNLVAKLWSDIPTEVWSVYELQAPRKE